MAPAAAAALLQIDGLGFGHAGEPPLFVQWSAALGPGLHRLDGESGSGKTTLLRLIAGELQASGRCRLAGLDLAQDAEAWRRAVCRVDARDPALDGLTPAALCEALARRHPPLDKAAWQCHVAGFGLLAHADKTLHMLSTGMRRKALLAAQLASGATLLLLDEPLAGLDGPAVSYLVAALAAWAQAPQHVALIVSGRWPDGLPEAGAIRLPG